jgi:hypothetical protein
MGLGITDLINNIQSSIQGLISEFTGNGDDKSVPNYFYNTNEFKGIQSQITQSNWNKLSFPYTFVVVDIVSAGAPSPFGDFALPLAPQNINQSEEPAINIKPTQGGTTVNHNGNRYKTLTISGTTGIAPFRGDGGVNRQTGEAIFQPKDLKHKSGYEVFLHLRNWLRTYYEYKHKRGTQAQDLRLVFKNYKDGEFLVVELLRFEMDRQAAKSFLYDYKIEFKVLCQFQFSVPGQSTLEQIENGIQSAFDKIDEARGIFLRTQGILRQVESTYENVVVQPLRKASLAVKALKGIGTVAADVSQQAIKDTVSAADTLAITLGIQKQQIDNAVTGTLDPRIAAIKIPSDPSAAIAAQGSSFINTFGEGLMALDPSIFPPKTQQSIIDDQTSSQTLPRSFYQQTRDSLVRVRQNAEDYFNLGSTQYNSIFDRTSTLTPNNGTVTNDQYDLLYAFNQAIIGMDLLMSVTDLFNATYSDRIDDMNTRFNNNIQLFANQAVKIIRVPSDTPIERIAQQQLGDSTLWGEIVELNSLKAPYIVQDISQKSDGVLVPGDQLMIPISPRNGFSQIPQGADNKLTLGLSQQERSLGCDFKLTPEFDLGLTNSGDFELIAGAPNMGQGVMLRLSYEPQDVIAHPELGAGIVPGKKFPALEDLKDNVFNTLLQDPRIEKVENLSLIRNNNALYLSFTLRLKAVDIPIPIMLKVA